MYLSIMWVKLERLIYKQALAETVKLYSPGNASFSLVWPDKGTSIGQSGEFDQSPENAYRAGFSLIRLSKPPASSSSFPPTSSSIFFEPSTAIAWDAFPLQWPSKGRECYRRQGKALLIPCAVHSRFVFPAAIAGPLCQWRCATCLPLAATGYDS
jgi:hypothetical protein